MTTASDSVLDFTDVSVAFRSDGPTASAPAVDGVSLSLRRGEIFGIVGESGSGKSTLANTVLGLLPSSATVRGHVRVNDRDVLGLSESDLRALRGDEVAMIFQDASASLDPTWPVGDQIAETIRAHRAIGRRAAREQAIALMTEVGIPDAASRYGDAPHRLSGGMRQRIVIAAALANNPQLLIADEPATALDVTIQAQILQLIDRLRRDHGTTVLLITHDLGVVAQVCDRVGVMYAGRLLEVGTAHELFARPTHPYTRALLAASPNRVARGTRLPVVPAQWSVESLHESEAVAEAEAAQ
ncbi:ABC transporter ATP-binding protein [Naasia lichenicola]|uniref:ABC transporter ATP-binding protein n=1 Tax=Naasia lichenicola TaxID=2565933 RepID=A0A4S4FNR2_9MICO|nr:ABC transporter ATP-binding protein [Naasia lichenicola]THG30644.1 ABC transporter ATP-binding protein [Naasia lichenicola]THG31881.1 ABC transporter ATP-binding protein [Naasia lichenicola]